MRAAGNAAVGVEEFAGASADTDGSASDKLGALALSAPLQRPIFVVASKGPPSEVGSVDDDNVTAGDEELKRQRAAMMRRDSGGPLELSSLRCDGDFAVVSH